MKEKYSEGENAWNEGRKGRVGERGKKCRAICVTGLIILRVIMIRRRAREEKKTERK